MKRIFVLAALVLAVFVNVGPAQQLLQTDGFGSVSGKVTLNGPLPEVFDLTELMKKHADKVCCLAPKAKPAEKVDLTWVVDPKTKAVANVMVWVRPPVGKFFPIHNSYKVRKETITIDQPHCQYLPRVSAFQPYYLDNGKEVETGQKLVFKNSAVVQHNVRVVGNGIDNVGFNKNLPAGTEIDATLKPQRLPLEVRCDIHTWMTARVFVFDHPYYALTNEKGEFNIPFVPAGAQITIMAWHEGVGYVSSGASKGQPITVANGKASTIDFELKYEPANGK